MFTVNMEDL
jgi:hypothetical protein